MVPAFREFTCTFYIYWTVNSYLQGNSHTQKLVGNTFRTYFPCPTAVLLSLLSLNKLDMCLVKVQSFDTFIIDTFLNIVFMQIFVSA